MATAEVLAWTGQPAAQYYNTGNSATRRRRTGPNAIFRSAAHQIIYEIHDLARKNLLVLSLLNSWETNTVGTGITPRFPVVNSPEERNALTELWRESQSELDADQMQTFYGLQSTVARSVLQSGEVFARFRTRRPSDGFRVPLQVQLLESAMLPVHKAPNENTETGNTIENGIEYDAIGRRVAYHFYRTHPGERSLDRPFDIEQTTRVPANQVLHMGIPSIPGEKRIISSLGVAIENLKIYDAARLNMADRIRIGASFAGFVQRSDEDYDSGSSGNTPILGEGAHNAAGSAASDAQTEVQMVYLEDGETITFPELPDIGSNYLDFMQSFEQLFAASYGMTYEQVSGNLHRVSFSSARVGQLEMRRRILQFVARCLVHQFSSKVIRRWMQEAVISGAIDLLGFVDNPAPWYAVAWRHPGWQAINPVDEVMADEKAVQSGFDSRSNIALTKYDRDPEQLDEEIADDQQRAEQLSLNFTTTVSSSNTSTSNASSPEPPVGEATREQLELLAI